MISKEDLEYIKSLPMAQITLGQTVRTGHFDCNTAKLYLVNEAGKLIGKSITFKALQAENIKYLSNPAVNTIPKKPQEDPVQPPPVQHKAVQQKPPQQRRVPPRQSQQPPVQQRPAPQRPTQQRVPQQRYDYRPQRNVPPRDTRYYPPIRPDGVYDYPPANYGGYKRPPYADSPEQRAYAQSQRRYNQGYNDYRPYNEGYNEFYDDVYEDEFQNPSQYRDNDYPPQNEYYSDYPDQYADQYQDQYQEQYQDEPQGQYQDGLQDQYQDEPYNVTDDEAAQYASDIQQNTDYYNEVDEQIEKSQQYPAPEEDEVYKLTSDEMESIVLENDTKIEQEENTSKKGLFGGGKKKTKKLGKPTKKGCQTIAVCGPKHGSGTTHHAIAIVNYLTRQGFKACYIDARKTSLLEDIALCDSRMETCNCYYKYDNRIIMFPKSTPVQDIINEKYQFLVFDYGCDEFLHPTEYLTRNVKITSVGSKPWETASMHANIKEGFYDTVNIIMNFSDPKERKEIQEAYKELNINFAEYDPNPFKGTANDDIYYEILKPLFA